jgi:cytochrome c-type biogenesis protein CcmF
LLAFWIVTTVAVNLWERVRITAGRSGVFQKLRMQSRSYYGMQLAHVGVAAFIIGVTLVTQYQNEKDVRMNVGDTVDVGGYVFQFNGVTNVTGPNYQAARADIEVIKNGKSIRTMQPEKRVYNVSENAMTETAIDTGLFRDLYLSLGEPLGGGAWSVRVHYKPFVDWIWGGAVLMAVGGGLAVSDRRYALAARKQREALAAAKESAEPALARVSIGR